MRYSLRSKSLVSKRNIDVKKQLSSSIARHLKFSPRFEELEDRLTPAAPAVLSINRLVPADLLTNAASVSFAVAFDQAVTGVDASDFRVLKGNGVVAGAIVVTGNGASYTVGVSGIAGNGNVRLGLVDDDSIVAVADGQPLNGPGGSAGFAGTVTYTNGSQASAMILADVNGDSKPDIITASIGPASTIYALLGN